MTNSCIINQPKPKIEYILKAVGGSLTALPGVSDMIDASSFFPLIKTYFLMFHCWFGILTHYSALITFGRIL
jgi:hypothetical protein